MSPIAFYVVAAAIVGAPPQARTGDEAGDAEVAGKSTTPEGPTPVDERAAPSGESVPSQTTVSDTEPETTESSSDTNIDDLPHRPAAELIQRRRVEARRGRALTIAGATLTGLGLAGRIGFDVFLATVADLAPREPFGQWSYGPIFMATTFTNVPTLVGVGLLGGGSYYQARAHGRRFDHPSSRRTKRTAWGLLGGGLGLWGLSRALFVPWTRACESNACAYGYLESSYYVSAGLVITGVLLVAREAGFERAQAEEKADYIKIRARRPMPTLSPIVTPGFQGLSLSGRF